MTLDEQNSCVDMYLSFNEVFDIIDPEIFNVEETDIPEEVLEKARARDQAKSDKNYELSDSLRDEIQDM